MNMTEHEFDAQVKLKDDKWKYAKFTGVKFAKILSLSQRKRTISTGNVFICKLTITQFWSLRKK